MASDLTRPASPTIATAQVSVVMPARNAAATIAASVRSVLACPEVAELVVIDDGSTDDTGPIAAAFGHRVRVIPGPAIGIAAALNAGFAAATGELVARCDADDLFAPDRFAWQVPLLSARSDLVAVTGGFQTMLADTTPIVAMACEIPEGSLRADLLAGRSLTHFCTWLVRRQAVLGIGGARSWFVTAEDLDLMFRLAEQGDVWHLPRITYHYRLHDHSIVHSQPNQLRLFYEEAARTFAAERRQGGGVDRLSAGTPPTPPTPAPSAAAMSTQAQVLGQLIGLAWGHHKVGERVEARKTIRRALHLFPTSPGLWRHAILLHLRR